MPTARHEDLMLAAFHRLEVAQVRPETPAAVSLVFAVPAGLSAAYRFEPGQHLTLRTQLHGVETRRSYSVCAGLDDGELRIAVKRVEDGVFSRWLSDTVKAGDRIDVMTPQGRFGLRPDPLAARTYLAIAAGSGITPVISIVRSVLARERRSRVVLLYGNRTTQSIIFKEALEDLKDRFLDRFSLLHVLSRERQELALLNGRIDADKIATVLRRLVPADRIDQAFLCGPAGLIEQSRASLLRGGVSAARIHVEHFTIDGLPRSFRHPSRTKTEGDEPGATVRVRLNGVEHGVALLAGESILEAGLRHGLDMPFSCRAGMCCTCRAMLTQGKVEMDQNYSLEPWELQAGYVLTCQARPVTPNLVVDYDHI
jgi:ring-1,2-phenylacetyl-CoA epoxidase subunit PaaE